MENEEIMLKERIRQMLTYKRSPIARLSENRTLQNRYGRQINGEAAVPISTLSLLLRMFPDISAEWLVTGEGEMLKSDNSKATYSTHNVVHGNTSGNIGNISIGNYEQIIAEKDKRIAELEHDKKMLQDVLAALSQTTREKYGPKQ